jgi:REP element-mobilizing transposase RayT
MPRPARDVDSERFAHLTMHAVANQRLFVVHGDAVRFLTIVGEVVSSLEVHAYCLMPTHVHVLIRDPGGEVSKVMRDLNGRYARWFNHRRGRRGPLFANRFHRTTVEWDGHLLAVVRYIAMNPVEAGLCKRPADWRWSSHRALAGLIQAPSFLRTDVVLGMLGSTEEYERFVEGER